MDGDIDKLWIIAEVTPLKDNSVETLFIALSKMTGIHLQHYGLGMVGIA